MKKFFVDTNVFMRYLRKDNLEQSKIAEKYFMNAVWGKYELRASVVVFMEIYWVLTNVYEQKKEILKERLLEVLDLKVGFVGKKVFGTAVQEMDKFNYDLEDAFNFYTAKELEVVDLVTFDKKLQKLWKKGLDKKSRRSGIGGY